MPTRPHLLLANPPRRLLRRAPPVAAEGDVRDVQPPAAMRQRLQHAGRSQDTNKGRSRSRCCFKPTRTTWPELADGESFQSELVNIHTSRTRHIGSVCSWPIGWRLSIVIRCVLHGVHA